MNKKELLENYLKKLYKIYEEKILILLLTLY